MREGIARVARATIVGTAALMLVASAKKAPPPATTPFSPGQSFHEDDVEGLTTRAAQAIVTMGLDTDMVIRGLVTSTWTPYHAVEWPGFTGRMVIVITETKVSVALQCRYAGFACSGGIPNGEEWTMRAGMIASSITGSDDGDVPFVPQPVEPPKPKFREYCVSVDGAVQCFPTEEACEERRSESPFANLGRCEGR